MSQLYIFLPQTEQRHHTVVPKQPENSEIFRGSIVTEVWNHEAVEK